MLTSEANEYKPTEIERILIITAENSRRIVM